MARGESNGARVFISYARRDLPIAERLREELTAAGFDAFLDVHDIQPGEPWQDRLGALIATAEKIVFLISPTSVASEICGWEVDTAEGQGKSVLPVVIRDTELNRIPGRLRRLNFLYLRGESEWLSGLAALTQALSTDLAWEREKTRIQELASIWETEGRPPRRLLTSQDAIRAAESWRDAHPETAPPPTELQLVYIAESRARHTRRQRGTATAAIGIALVTGALAILFLIQRSEAQDRADELALRTITATATQAAAQDRAGDAPAATRSMLAAWDLAAEQGARAGATEGWLDVGLHARRAVAVSDVLQPLSSVLASMQDGEPFVWRGETFRRRGDGIQRLEPWAAVHKAVTGQGRSVLLISGDGTLSVWEGDRRIHRSDTSVNVEPFLYASADGDVALLVGMHGGPTGGSTYEVVGSVPLTSEGAAALGADETVGLGALRESVEDDWSLYGYFIDEWRIEWPAASRLVPRSITETVRELGFPARAAAPPAARRFDEATPDPLGVRLFGAMDPDELARDDAGFLARALEWMLWRRGMADGGEQDEPALITPDLDLLESRELGWLSVEAPFVRRDGTRLIHSLESMGNAGRSEFACVAGASSPIRCAYFTAQTNEIFFGNRSLPLPSAAGDAILILNGGSLREGVELYVTDGDATELVEATLYGLPDQFIVGGDITRHGEKVVLATSQLVVVLARQTQPKGYERIARIAAPASRRFLTVRYVDDSTVVAVLYTPGEDGEEIREVSVAAYEIESGNPLWETDLPSGEVPRDRLFESVPAGLAVSASQGLVAVHGARRVHLLDARLGLPFGSRPLPGPPPDFADHDYASAIQDRLGMWFTEPGDTCAPPCLRIRGAHLPLFREVDAALAAGRLRREVLSRVEFEAVEPASMTGSP